MKDEIKCLKKGDKTALERIMDRYSGYVCAVARNFSRGALSEEDIDDIFVEVFYKLWKNRENLNAEKELCPYLSAAARNAVKDRFKKRPPVFEDITELELSSDIFVEEKAELTEMTTCLREGLKTLPDEDAEIFLRFYYHGERSREIAAAKGIPENTVRTKLKRSREKLRTYMTERGFGYD